MPTTLNIYSDVDRNIKGVAMMRLLQLGMVCRIGLGTLGMWAPEASADRSPSQRPSPRQCQTVQTHGIDDNETHRQALARDSQDIDALNQLGYEQLKRKYGGRSPFSSAIFSST